MEQFKRSILAVLAGIEVVFSMLSPILVALMWGSYAGYEGISSNLLVAVGFLTSIYRAIKIGFLTRKDD